MRSAIDRRTFGDWERGMEPARVGYHRIVADILRRAPAEDAARIAWQLVSGTKVSLRTSVIELSEGALKVRVPDAAWRMQLAEFVPQYLHALNGMLSGRVERIEFVPEEKKTPHRA